MDRTSTIVITFTCLGILLGLFAGYVLFSRHDCSDIPIAPILETQEDIKFIPVEQTEPEIILSLMGER